MEKLGALLAVLLLAGSLVAGATVAQSDGDKPKGIGKEKSKYPSKETIRAMAKDLEEKCDVTDRELKAEGLNNRQMKKVRKFCALPLKAKEKILEEKFDKLKRKKSCSGEIVGRNNSYSCWTWYGGYNTGIPNYADLGLTSSECGWHDNSPTECSEEGEVACLWGCTNVDPELGWSSHEKVFSSQTALENEIFSQGYHQTADYACGDPLEPCPNDYTRGIDYGYRYQVNWDGDKAHVEGPEPNPESNWYGFVNDFWPEEVTVWHSDC